jgi:hypothetical protein
MTEANLNDRGSQLYFQKHRNNCPNLGLTGVRTCRIEAALIAWQAKPPTRSGERMPWRHRNGRRRSIGQPAPAWARDSPVERFSPEWAPRRFSVVGPMPTMAPSGSDWRGISRFRHRASGQPRTISLLPTQASAHPRPPAHLSGDNRPSTVGPAQCRLDLRFPLRPAPDRTSSRRWAANADAS